MAPTASGSPGPPGAAAPTNTLILTVTRACNLRCSYCPTAKAGWPDLSPNQARQAVAMFDEVYGGGTIKLFGGEPLLVPDTVRAALDEARRRPSIRRVMLSTNGLGLDADWLDRVAADPKLVLTLSLDGRPEDHRRHRHALPGVVDAYDHVMGLLEPLRRTPRVVVTQTLPPATAHRGRDNFDHLLQLGFTRFNLLPGYYLPWKPRQLDGLSAALRGIEARIRRRWRSGDRLYLRNLFTWAPTPFFNTGLVVDADATIHPSNVGLSGQLDALRGQTQLGTLDDPPSPQALRDAAPRTNALLAEALPPAVWTSTQAVDRALSATCRRLYPAYVQARRVRRARRTHRAAGPTP